MSAAGRTLSDLVERAVRRVRAEAVIAVALGVAAVAPLVLLAAWLVGGAWPSRGVAPLAVAVGSAVGALALAAVLVRVWVAPVRTARIAAEAERRRGLPEGALRAVLELGRELPPGSSPALLRRSEADLARGLGDATPRELGGELGDRTRRLRVRSLAALAVLAGLAATAGFTAPDRARAGWAPLLHPIAHLSGAALPPLSVTPGDAAVPRGETAAIRLEAPGRSLARLHWTSVGDVPGARTLEVRSGVARADLGPVRAEIRYWARTPDGAVTDTFTLRPVDPLLLGAVAVDLSYPPHVDRPPDHYEGEIPPLEVPEGTRLRFAGSATRPMAVAELGREDGARKPLNVAGDGFTLEWRLDPTASGRWDWRVRGLSGEEAVEPGLLELRVLADAPPRVRIASPEVEAPMPPSLRQVVVADAEDDHGVRSAALVLRRVGGGDPGPESRVPLPVEAAGTRVVLRGVLDATRELLAPGDAVEYRVEVVDNSPARQVGRSATHVLRLAALAELRERARSEARAAAEAAERLAERSRSLQRETRDLARQAAGGGAGTARRSPGRPASSERMGFEAAREAEAVLAEHDAVREETAALRDRVEALDRAAEGAGLRDPELQRRLAELRDLLERLVESGARDEADQLRQALEALDEEAVERALEALAQEQEGLRETLDRSLELMRRAATEQELVALAREAEEIAARQRALAEALAEEAGAESAREAAPRAEASSPQDDAGLRREGADSSATARPGKARPAGADSAASEGAADSTGAGLSIPRPSLPIPRPIPDRAEQQDSLWERAQRLNASLQALQPQLLQMGEPESASEAGAAQESGEAAQQSMRDASSKARQQQGSRAAESGRQAAGQMADAAARLDAARRGMAEARQEEAQRAVQQATQEALELARREEAVRRELEEAQRRGSGPSSVQPLRSEQAALEQGLQQLGQNLSDTGRRSGLVSPEVGQALARALLDMQLTREGLEEGSGALPVEEAGRAVESLNRLALSLLQNDASLQQSRSGAADQALRRLAELAREQGSLNAQSAAVPPLELGDRALTQQLQELARQQRGIGRRAGELGGMLGGREDVLGQLDPIASEAEQLARQLEGGRLDAEVRARQERLFRRLLDAGRSLEREEYSDERQGREAGSVAAEAAPALDPALLDPRLRFAPPTAEELRALPPAYRRLILDYFERLNRDGAAEHGGER